MISVNYKFCPVCAGDLDFSKFGDNSPICLKCGFKFYQNSRPTVGAIITDDSRKVLLLKRAKNPSIGMLQNPGGFLMFGEDPKDGLIREVEEEVGVRVSIGKFIGMYTDEYLDDERAGTYATLNLFFEAKIVSGKPRALDETDEVSWFSKDEIKLEELAFENTKQALKDFFANQ